MSGDSATLALGVGSTVFNAIQGYRQADVASSVAAARSEAQAQYIEAAAQAQAATLGAQASVKGFQAAQLGQRAELTRARLSLRKAQERREGRRRQGRRRGQFAGRGITRRGTPTDVLADAAAEEALNLAILEFEGETRATQFEQGAALRRHEAGILNQQAGLTRALGRRRASFVRRQGTAGGADPLAAGLSAGISTAVSSGLPELVGGWLADGPDTSPSPTANFDRGRTAVNRRRSRFKRSLLS